MLKKFIKNDSALAPGRAIIILLVIVAIIILIYLSVTNADVKCDPQDQVALEGLLRGFERNNSYWNVKIGNQTFLFNVFDPNYMRPMIGYNVTVNCCYRHDTTFLIGHYDMSSAFISEG